MSERLIATLFDAGRLIVCRYVAVSVGNWLRDVSATTEMSCNQLLIDSAMYLLTINRLHVCTYHRVDGAHLVAN